MNTSKQNVTQQRKQTMTHTQMSKPVEYRVVDADGKVYFTHVSEEACIRYMDNYFMGQSPEDDEVYYMSDYDYYSIEAIG